MSILKTVSIYLIGVILLFTAIFFFYKGNSSDLKPIIAIDSSQVTFEKQINNWHIIGPFLVDSQIVRNCEQPDGFAINHDYLFDCGVNEKSFTSTHFVDVNKDNFKYPSLLSPEFINSAILDSNQILNFSKYFLKTENATIYAYCDIDCSKEQTVLLTCASDDGMKAWLNGKLIISKPDYRGLNMSTDVDYWIETLKKGKNTLLVKVFNGAYDWGLQVKLYGGDKIPHMLATPNFVKLLNKVIYNSTDSLCYLESLYNVVSNGQDLKMRILNCSGEVERSTSMKTKLELNPSLSELVDGLHLLEIQKDTLLFKQWFYKGESLEHYYTKLEKQSNIFGEDKLKTNLLGLLFRIKHLIQSENIKKNDLEWQNKFVDVCKQLELILNDVKIGVEPFINKRGMWIRGFKSKIDDQNQYYLLYVPSTYTPSVSSQLVLVVPYVTIPSRHFLKSYLLAHIPDIKDCFYEAEKNGVIMVWPGGRAYSDGMPIAVAEVQEVINDVKSNYNINKSNVSLIGACSGGLDALTFSTRFPSQYASFAVFSPFTTRISSFKSSFNLNPIASEIWGKQNSPIEYVENLSNTKLFILHSKNNHAPIVQSKRFVAECDKKNILHFHEFTQTDFGLNYFGIPYSHFTPSQFFNSSKNNLEPNKISFSTSQLKYNESFWIKINRRKDAKKSCKINAEYDNSANEIKVVTDNIVQFSIDLTKIHIARDKPVIITTNGNALEFKNPTQNSITIDVVKEIFKNNWNKNHDIEGPIAHAFSSSFLLVDCQGDAGPNNKMSNPCKSIYNGWKNSFFVDSLRYKNAKEVLQSDIDSFNLVLFGNESNNVILNRLSSKLPIKLYHDKIKLCGKPFSGKSLGIIFTFPNPANPNKYIVVITSNNWSNFSLPETNLSLEAFYDFIIFDSRTVQSDHVSKILGYGDFNENWSQIDLF